MPNPLLEIHRCRYCKRIIRPTEFGTWEDVGEPHWEVCDLEDDNGTNHEPNADES